MKAERCTDGIWMSLAREHDRYCIVMDSEGLFSQERDTQEEIKLLLLLIAVSDFVIFNRDNSIGRTAKKILEKMKYSIGKL